MFNLLTKEAKMVIRHEYRLRLAVVALWCLFATLLIASVLLVPSLVLSAQKEKAAQSRFDSLSKHVEAGEAAHFSDTLREARETLELLPRANRPLFELLSELAALGGSRVSLESFSITGAGEGKRRLDISGTAANRAALIAFKENLEKSGHFETVVLPPSNLAKDINLEFSLYAAGAF